MSAADAIRSTGLTKSFPNGRGCRDVSITVRKGEAFGFLGPNGAGKSTFVKMLVGLTRPTEGSAALMGHPIGSLQAKACIGYLPELFRYQEWLSGEEVLMVHARLCGLDKQAAKRRIAKLLDEVGIGRRGTDKVKHYSKGMQQRLGLACALMSDPDILFLDEPASALDPVGRKEVRDLLAEQKRKGKTLFLNSHLLEDVERLCDRMALLNDGVILRHGTVDEVLERRAAWRFKIGGYAPSLVSWLKETTGLTFKVIPAKQAAGSSGGNGLDDSMVWLEAELPDEEQAAWLNALLIGQGMVLYETVRQKERLEEWFISALSGLSHRGEKA